MAKYDAQLAELKSLLPNAQKILITLAAGSDIDRFASGLALFLSFETQGKEVFIACDDVTKVAQSHLFGIDHVKNILPASGAGDFVITLEGVAIPDPSGKGGKVPSLEKLDYFVTGNNLNLVLKVLPGQTFQPTNMTSSRNTGFNLVFVIGASSLSGLGNIYTQNSQVFSGTHIVNIDNQTLNTSFGQTNVVDSSSSSISEIMAEVITNLNLPFDADIATNLLAGIFDATGNLTDPRVSADTYLSVSTCLRVGGRKPGESPTSFTQQPGQGLDLSAFVPKSAGNIDGFPPIPQDNPTPIQPEFTVPPVISSQPEPLQQASGGSIERPSAEERPMGEIASTSDEKETSFEPGWLTPKVFKGTSVG